MADFKSWHHDSLVKFCEESQAEIVRMNNHHTKVLKHYKMLLDEYARLADECIKKPERNHVYRACNQLFETQ